MATERMRLRKLEQTVRIRLGSTLGSSGYAKMPLPRKARGTASLRGMT
jgi:hypothetical protein